ncbi:glycosyltransferase family 2 protein [Nocardioides oleivorans]|uniref:glycosyltransferase family 2 protein n=1 Tax=Nocardioides oleivorans TaxID=273676 RepID=UPI001F5DC872|nr:glycosyltransferase family 2 protein [Nocardioides oleivorans]
MVDGGGARRVAVVVVTYDSAPLLPALVASLDAGLAGLDWELVVADNASSDDTVARVRELLPGATVVETGGNLGYSAGINAGVAAAAPHDAVLVLNPDVRLEPGCAATLMDALDEPRVGVAVPRLADAGGRLIWSLRREPTLTRAMGEAFLGATRAGRVPALGEVVTDPASYDAAVDTDWAEGSTQLISARCWAEVGPWDPSWFLYSEETDYGLRVRDAGWRTRYVPEARAVHLEGPSGTAPGLRALLLTNRVRLVSRHRGRVVGSAFWALTVAREGIRVALGKAGTTVALKALLSPRLMRAERGPAWVAAAVDAG